MASATYKTHPSTQQDLTRAGEIPLILKGVSSLNDYIERSGTLQLGVAGSSGAGKSSFINALRGLTAEDEGSAEVGVTETTMKATLYRHPQDEQLLIYDLPGVGTSKFPRESYLTNQDVGFERYDVFVIISCTRFTDEDLWLTEEIKKRGKSYYFVRTKVAEDIANQKRAKPKFFKTEPNAASNVVREIRTACEMYLKNWRTDNIFLIDNYEPDHCLLDFDKLLSKLHQSISKNKRETFILSLWNRNEKLVEEKKEALKKRAYSRSLWSAASNLVPIPGVAAVADVALITKEFNFYLEQFGLDKESITQIASEEQMTLPEFAANLELTLSKLDMNPSNTAVMYLAKYGASKLVESAAKIFLPGIGSLVSGSVSYYTTLGVLLLMIKDIGDDVMKVNAHVNEKVKRSFDLGN